MKLTYPDYHNCIANLACSILHYYGVTPPNPTLPQADKLLCRPYKNVVLLLLDGMGVSSMKQHLSEHGFFRRNLKSAYSSTFPPTTVAATTAVNSGLFPNQSAWLGWTGYFKELDRNIVYFFSADNDTGEQLNFDVANTLVPYKSIQEQIREAGTDAWYLMPFAEPYPKTYDALCEEIKKLCNNENRNYIYAYWDEPDATMHKNGVDGDDIRQLLSDIEAKTEQLAGELNDTLLLITADHGHINIRTRILTDYPDITECLLRMPSMEPRALNFFIKEGRQQQFEQAFRKHFGETFLLFSKNEVRKKQLLGCGNNHAKLDQMLGDYLAVAIDDIALCNTESEHKGNHAGLTEEEMTIPLIAVEL